MQLKYFNIFQVPNSFKNTFVKVGKDRLPEMKDKVHLHYVNAVIDEVNRMSSLVPLALVHRPMKDTTYNGYDFPSTFGVMPNIYSVHHDERLIF